MNNNFYEEMNPDKIDAAIPESEEIIEFIQRVNKSNIPEELKEFCVNELQTEGLKSNSPFLVRELVTFDDHMEHWRHKYNHIKELELKKHKEQMIAASTPSTRDNEMWNQYLHFCNKRKEQIKEAQQEWKSAVEHKKLEVERLTKLVNEKKEAYNFEKSIKTLTFEEFRNQQNKS